MGEKQSKEFRKGEIYSKDRAQGSKNTTSTQDSESSYNDRIERKDTGPKGLKFVGGSFSQDIRNVYKFKEVIGGGHFGSVRIGYKRNETPRKYYAIKSICMKNISKEDIQHLFREVEIIRHLSHPNIIKFYETYYDEKYFHISMELCQGKDVFEKIIENGFISEQIVAKIIVKVLHAISYCHSKGITHRDLKPENILFLTNDSSSEIKLIDFGLARKYDHSKEKMSSVLGTPYYIAPEVLKGEYDSKCDVWSIGAMTYIMLSGDLPFNGNTNNEVFTKIAKEEISFKNPKWNQVTKEAIDFIKCCMKKNPQDRLSAKEALNHSWFTNILKKVHSEVFLKNDILLNLKKFESKHTLKNFVLTYIVHTLNASETQKFKDAFYAIDLDHTGHITIDELKQAYKIANIEITDEELKDIMEKLTKHQENEDSFDYSMFKIASVDQEAVVTLDRLKKAFNYLDINGDGYVDTNDLKQAFLRAGIDLLNADSEIKYMIRDVAKKNKEKISFKKFIKIFNY